MPIAYTPEITLALCCTDLDRSIAWYQDVLGLELLYKVDEIAWCELSTHMNGIRIGLSQVEKMDKGRSGCVPTFSIKNVDEARNELSSKDVRFDGETQTIEGMVRLATFFDPDGNAFMLAESLHQEGG